MVVCIERRRRRRVSGRRSVFFTWSAYRSVLSDSLMLSMEGEMAATMTAKELPPRDWMMGEC